MTAFNVVRFKVKPGMEETFLDAHKRIADKWMGLTRANIIRTGEGRFAIIGNGRAWTPWRRAGRR